MAFRDIRDHEDILGDESVAKWRYSERMTGGEAYYVVRGEAMYWIQTSKLFDWICCHLDLNPSYLRGCALSKAGRKQIINNFARFESTRKYHEKDYRSAEEDSEEDDF